jgi:hypothetical protein
MHPKNNSRRTLRLLCCFIFILSLIEGPYIWNNNRDKCSTKCMPITHIWRDDAFNETNSTTLLSEANSWNYSSLAHQLHNRILANVHMKETQSSVKVKQRRNTVERKIQPECLSTIKRFNQPEWCSWRSPWAQIEARCWAHPPCLNAAEKENNKKKGELCQLSLITIHTYKLAKTTN